MRFSLPVLFTASLVSGFTLLQRQNNVPTCASTCYTSSDPSPCNATDTPCLCMNANYTAAVASCMGTSCSGQDFETGLTAGAADCKAAGVDTLNPFPACSNPCIAGNSLNLCDYRDLNCLCKDNDYIQFISKCLPSSCTDQDLKTAKLVVEAWCRSGGVDISSIIEG